MDKTTSFALVNLQNKTSIRENLFIIRSTDSLIKLPCILNRTRYHLRWRLFTKITSTHYLVRVKNKPNMLNRTIQNPKKKSKKLEI